MSLGSFIVVAMVWMLIGMDVTDGYEWWGVPTATSILADSKPVNKIDDVDCQHGNNDNEPIVTLIKVFRAM